MFSERLGIPTFTGTRNLNNATSSVMRQAGQPSTSPVRAAVENSSSPAGNNSPGAQSSQYSPIFLQVTCLRHSICEFKDLLISIL